MACKHRFIEQLFPDWELEYLFVGTFNPSWNFNNASQADYFYGRSRNNFWCILPKVFGGESLKNNTLQHKLSYIKHKKIGITDIVKTVINADEQKQQDIKNLTSGFSDNILNRYELEFNTESIKTLIEKNSKTLKGVYLTRSTLNGINQIANQWYEIVTFCKNHSIATHTLKTPANYGGGCQLKAEDWRNKITIT